MEVCDKSEIELPFQTAKDVADLLAKRHHLSTTYKMEISPAAEKGDNLYGSIYRVRISGTQGEKYIDLVNDQENIAKNVVNDETHTSFKRGVLRRSIKNENIKGNPAKNDIHFYKPDNLVGFPYRRGQHLELNVVFKIAPNCKARRGQENVKSHFKREILMYTKVLKRFMEMQELSEIENKIEFPKIYAYSLEEEKEFIVFEDLKSSGYRMYSKHGVIDYNHASLAMKNIGKFHALSFTMKHKYPEEFEEYKNLSENIFIDPLPETYKRHWKTSFQQAVQILKPTESELINQMEAFRDHHEDVFIQFTKGSKGEPYSCINHGDFWNNNMMFSYDNQDTIPTKVKFLDFQMSRYCSPLLDLMHYLFCCTDGDFREKYYEEMLHIYHKSFTDFAKELGCSPKHIISFSNFENELKRFGIYGLSMAIIGLVFLISNKEDNVCLNEIAKQYEKNIDIELKLDLSENTLINYRERMGAVIRDTSKYGYFNR